MKSVPTKRTQSFTPQGTLITLWFESPGGRVNFGPKILQSHPGGAGQ